MKPHMIHLGIVLLIFWLSGNSIATACERPPFSDVWDWGGSSAWEESDGDCQLDVQIAAIDAPATASVSYLRRDPAAPLELRFTIDSPDLPQLNSIQGASVARGTAHHFEESSSRQGPVFDVVLFGNLSASNYYLSVSGWCSDSLPCSTLVGPYTQADFPLDVAIDVETGHASAGRIRLWVNADLSSAPPSVQLVDLDNAVTEGIDRVVVGLFSTTPAFNQVASGHPFILGGLATSDDQLFWTGFERTLARDTPTNQPAILPLLSSIGTTCGGTSLLPQVANGTTTLYGPVAVHSISLSELSISLNLSSSNDTDLMMFLCPPGAGPSDGCFAAGTSNGINLDGAFAQGEYQLVVGATRVGAACDDYVISWTGPL